jgi:thioester reductase-like protein
MAYFVTGATGFIGRFLVANLVKRGKPVYVLVRKGSQKKLDALREQWGSGEKLVQAVQGDLAKKNLGVSDADLKKLKGKVDHFFHLAAVYDLTASAEVQAGRQRRGNAQRGQVRRGDQRGLFRARELDRGRRSL